MKSHQLKNLVKGIIKEMIANKALKPDVFGAVNVEATTPDKDKPWIEIDHGFFKVNSDFARKLAGGKLPGPGMEKLVQAPRGFDSKRGFVWLAPTVVGGNPTWSIRDAGNWKLVNGIAVLSSTDVMADPKLETFDPKLPRQKPLSLSVPEKHQLKIALQTLRAPDAMVGVMGGMNKDEAREFLKRKGFTNAQISQVENPEVMEKKVNEMTATGAVAGYSTPFAFSKNKEGSGRAIKAAKKYGKVVKSISKEQ